MLTVEVLSTVNVSFLCYVVAGTLRSIASDQHACVPVCLSVCCPLVYLKKPYVQTVRHFLYYVLPVAVSRSSSDDGAIYVLPVLWMMSCFHMSLMAIWIVALATLHMRLNVCKEITN